MVQTGAVVAGEVAGSRDRIPVAVGSVREFERDSIGLVDNYLA
jgi:hypothetical protein